MIENLHVFIKLILLLLLSKVCGIFYDFYSMNFFTKILYCSDFVPNLTRSSFEKIKIHRFVYIRLAYFQIYFPVK